MSGRLSGKVTVLTGAAQGLGAAKARMFATEGAALLIGDLRDRELKLVCEEIASGGAPVVARHFDVTVQSHWKDAIAEVEATFGKIDVLVNNAAITLGGGVEDTSLEARNQVLAVNQTGVWLGMKHAIPSKRRAGGGSIVNLSSICGVVGGCRGIAYSGTKAAIRLLTKEAAVQCARDGIRINAVIPGTIETPMSNSVKEFLPSLIEGTPMRRMGRPEEVAYGALFLASDESSYITGAELVIDGGYTAK